MVVEEEDKDCDLKRVGHALAAVPAQCQGERIKRIRVTKHWREGVAGSTRGVHAVQRCHCCVCLLLRLVGDESAAPVHCVTSDKV